MDKHYSYIQGSGNLAIAKLRQSVLSGSEPLAKPDLLAGGRTALREPMPLPPGILGEVNAGSHQSTLLTFWAHWCANCRAELTEFTAHDAELRAAGVRIVPLSLDPSADEPKAREVAAALNMPYAVELLGESRTTLVAAVLRSVLDIHEDMAIPMSFLLDRENRIHVIFLPLRADGGRRRGGGTIPPLAATRVRT